MTMEAPTRPTDMSSPTSSSRAPAPMRPPPPLSERPRLLNGASCRHPPQDRPRVKIQATPLPGRPSSDSRSPRQWPLGRASTFPGDGLPKPAGPKRAETGGVRASWWRHGHVFTGSRLSRLSRCFGISGTEMDRIFYQQSTLPEQWLFEVPDFNFSLEDLKLKNDPQDEKGDVDDMKETCRSSFQVDFEPGYDPSNPKCWSRLYKVVVVAGFGLTALAIGIYTTAYSSGIAPMSEELEITNDALPSLGIALYLIGLALGTLIMAPLSETFGRRPMYIAGLSAFLSHFPLAALANNFLYVLLARFFGAVAGSVMLSNVAGSIIDIVDPGYIPLALSVYSFGPLNGPVLGPMVGGLIVDAFPSSWRATIWVCLVPCTIGAIFIMSIPETYKPTLIRRMVARKREETQDSRYWCTYDDHISFARRISIAVSRPFVLSFTEPVLMFWNIYISVIYAIAQVTFVSFPIIFIKQRGWSSAHAGVAFLGIFVGIAAALVFEPVFRRLVNRHPTNAETGRPEPEASVLIICIGAVLAPVGQLWFALTSLPAFLPSYISILSGIPFGLGFALVFIYGNGYVSSVFGIYSTSASAGNLVFRSLLGAAMVFGGTPMYKYLTPRTAGIIIGGLELILAPIPFVFYLWGKKIRQRSRLIRDLEAQTKKLG